MGDEKSLSLHAFGVEAAVGSVEKQFHLSFKQRSRVVLFSLLKSTIKPDFRNLRTTQVSAQVREKAFDSRRGRNEAPFFSLNVFPSLSLSADDVVL